MKTTFDYADRQRKLNLWRSSPEYQHSCQQFQAEFERLSLFTASQQFAILEKQRKVNTVRQEYASQSNLHRGFYCPSPVYDLIVGNTHRGKLLKRMTSRSNPTHTYGFDTQNHLLWCDYLHNSGVTMTEYLIYRDHAILGITFDQGGNVYLLTEEVYGDGKLLQYTRCLCPSLNVGAQYAELHRKDYAYDEAGICSCTWHQYRNPSGLPPAFGNAEPSPYLQPAYDRTEYTFQSEEGYIVSYSSGGITYYPKIRRNAKQSCK